MFKSGDKVTVNLPQSVADKYPRYYANLNGRTGRINQVFDFTNDKYCPSKELQCRVAFDGVGLMYVGASSLHCVA